ncbi:unnamed protein product [Diamesa tonsa]
MDCCSSNYNADFSKHPHNHHPHNYGGGGGSAASHPYYSQIYNQTSMRYPHTHAAHRDETIATGYGAGNSQQNFYDVGGGGSGGNNSGGSSYERYNNSNNNNNNSYLNHQHSSGTYPNTFNNNYGALRDSYGNGNNETNGHYYYHHQNQSTHHQPTTANGFYGSHSYDSYRNVSGNYPYHPHYNNNNTTATTTPPSTGYHHAQQQSLPSHFYPYNNNNSSNSSSEHYNNAATTSSRYYPTPPPSAPPPLPPSQRDPYAMRDPTLHQSNSDDSTYSPSGSDKHNNDNMSLDNFNQNTINSDSATTTPSLVSPTLSATQKSQQLSPNEDTDEITRSKSPLLTKAEHTPKHCSHQQTTCELSKINGDSEGREKTFPFNHHHTTKDFTNSHYRSRKSQRDKDKYFKTISSSRKAFDGQPLSVFGTNAQISKLNSDFDLWANQTKSRLNVSKNAYIKSVNESLANFFNIQNTFIKNQAYYVEVVIYYNSAYIDEARFRMLMTNKTKRVEDKTKEFKLNYAPNGIVSNALNDLYSKFYTNLESAVQGELDRIRDTRSSDPGPSEILCYESRKKSFFDIASADISTMEKLTTNATIALQKRVTDTKTDIDTKNTEVRNELWYRFYYPRSYGFATTEESVNAFITAKEGPMMAEIDSRFEELKSAITQIREDIQTLIINDPYERCSTPFVSMSPYNQNHMPHNYPPHQRLPPSFPPHGAGHGYWYSQPPHHPHHPWMMNPYARNRRGSFIDAQILPSSVHYGRSPSLHMDKHKIHGIHDETSPPKRTRKRAKPASASKPEVKEDLMKNVTPLPGFLQTFGGTEIGRFSEAFFTTAESPNPYYNNSIESDVESPQPWDYDSLEGPINLQVGAAFQLYGGSENEFDSPINNFSELICNEY